MKRLLLLPLFACGAVFTFGCGDSANVGKPEKPIEKLELDPKEQKNAGDYAPGP